jgi:undecaprenyl-diphosphatase
MSLAVFLGVLQGLTEFLPVSSSGHLVIAQQLYPGGVREAVAFDVCLHFGTLAAVVLYFRADLLAMALGMLGRTGDPERQARLRRWVWLLAVATVPIVIVGFTLAETLEHAFSSLLAVGLALFVTAGLLTVAARSGGGSLAPDGLRVRDAVSIGLFQALAVVPGISRSGATLTGGMLAGLTPDSAARFAFLLSLPAISGAVVLNLNGVGRLLLADGAAVAVGTTAAGVTGWLAIDIMMRAVRVGRLAPFAVYCAILGAVTLLLGLV